MLSHLSFSRRNTRSTMSFLGYSVSSFACILGMALMPSTARAQADYMPNSTANPTSFVSASYGVSGKPQGVAVADLNRDGKPDSIVADGTGNKISVVLSSSGSYAVTTYSTGSGSNPVGVAILPDFAGTGLPAVAVAEKGTSEVAVYSDSAAGVLTLNNTYSVGGTPTAILSADFNNDGIADIAVVTPAGVTVLLGSTNGSFSGPVETSVGANLVALAAGHFDATSNMDLAVVDQANNAVDILVGNNAGGFSVGNDYTVGTLPTCIAVADFNNDGRYDLVVGNYTDGTISVLLGNANDTFNLLSPATAAGGTVQALVVNDVNGDGIPDVIATNAQSGTTGNTLGVLIGNGDGTFSQAMTPELTGSPYGIATLDYNRDGKPDVVVTQSTAVTVSILLNNTLLTALPGGRNLQAPTQIGNGNMAVSVATADFNHDGFQDVAVAYFEDYTVGVMLGKGNGTFQTQSTYAVGKQPYAVAAADLNHDGYADIVTANESDGTISVLLNNRSGGFGSATSYTVGRLPTGIAIGDLNGDGIPDIAVANYGGNDVSILIGNGNGGFSPASTPTIAAQTNPYNVVMGDFNGDGKLDLAVTNKSSATISVFLGNGDGTFQSPSILSTNVFPTSIVVGDFNRDGNLDIAVGNSIANNVSIFLGKGNGTFQSPTTVTTLNFPVSMAVGDMNNDGIPDLVNVDPNYNLVSVLLGNGDGTFQARWQFPTCTTANPSKSTAYPGQQPWGVALADFNGDGKLDVVTANTIAQYNLTIPSYEPALGTTIGSPVSTSVLLNNSGATTTLGISPNGASIPDLTPITMTANVSPALSGVSPTGTVEFEDTDGTELGIAPISLAGGGAALTLQNMGSGQHVISTLYSGDVNFQPNSVVDGNVLVQVQGTPVTIVATPNTVLYKSTQQTSTGWNIKVTVNTTTTVKNTPTGTISVYFYTPSGAEYYVSFGGSNNHSISSTGYGTYQAGYSFTVDDPSLLLTPGVYEYYAIYNTGGNDQSGSSSNEQFTITLDPSTTVLSCTNPVVSGRGSTSATGTCTAKVSDTSGDQVSGLVDFSVNGGTATAVSLPTGASPQSATYNYTVANYTAGSTVTVTAEYMGNSNLGTSSATWTGSSTTTPTDILDIDAGGAAAAPYVADEEYSGGTANVVTANTITTTGVTSPAPQAVYQSERYGTMTYTIQGLTPSTQYTVVLQFAEVYFSGPNERQFNVLINGTQVLTNYDIYAAAGGEYIAIAPSFTATANSSGDIVIAFTNGAYNSPKVSGIQIQTYVAPTGSARSAPMAAFSSTTNSSFQPDVFSQNGAAGSSTNGGSMATIQPMQAGQSGNGGSGSGTAPQAQSPHRVMSHSMAP